MLNQTCQESCLFNRACISVVVLFYLVKFNMQVIACYCVLFLFLGLRDPRSAISVPIILEYGFNWTFYHSVNATLFALRAMSCDTKYFFQTIEFLKKHHAKVTSSDGDKIIESPEALFVDKTGKSTLHDNKISGNVLTISHIQRRKCSRLHSYQQHVLPYMKP